jgi:ABC-type branched-subunit amino acid transport system ATPase component
MSGKALLSVIDLAAGYGDSRVLFDVSLEICEGEVVTLLGRNGMGKTTTLGPRSVDCPASRWPATASGWCPKDARSFQI